MRHDTSRGRAAVEQIVGDHQCILFAHLNDASISSLDILGLLKISDMLSQHRLMLQITSLEYGTGLYKYPFFTFISGLYVINKRKPWGGAVCYSSGLLYPGCAQALAQVRYA